MADDPIATKLAAARTRLILDQPFLGALVMRLQLKAVQAEWCRTTGTDAKYFYYNPDYIADLSLSQTQFMLAHEALHCALSHFARRHHRHLGRWNLACDYAINPILVDEGLSPPPDVIILDQFRGMTAEEIYPLLQEDEQYETIDEHLYDQEGESNPNQPPQQPPDAQPQSSSSDNGQQGGQPQQQDDQAQPHQGEQKAPPPLSAEEKEHLDTQWQQRLAGAAQQALQAGKLSGDLARLVDHLLQPRLPWRALLARYMSLSARDDYSYMRPSRRSQGEAIFPALKSSQIDVVVAVDTSGSLRDEEIAEFLAEITALKAQVRARIHLLLCDADLSHSQLFEPWQEVKWEQKLIGGGSTDFRPVFQWVEQQGLRPELLIYFTDLMGQFPDKVPAYPVLWLVKGKEVPPWGQKIQLN